MVNTSLRPSQMFSVVKLMRLSWAVLVMFSHACGSVWAANTTDLRDHKCITHRRLYPQIYSDLVPWRRSGISQSLMNASVRDSVSHEIKKTTSAAVLIVNNRVYLSSGPLVQYTNDFIMGMLHELQVSPDAGLR